VAIAVAGGDLQDQAALQLILEYIDFGLGAEEAMAAPRFATGHHTGSFGQDEPRLGSLQVNVKIPEAVREDLKNRGHVLTTTPGAIGGAAMLVIGPANKVHGVGPAAGKVN
jgi:gamma-glutamyltranspeptidase/glutathione hydrolase